MDSAVHPNQSRELPVPLTPLVGRERERHGIVSMLERKDVRLLTLTGPGGVGKTRLAIQAAADLAAAFAENVVFIPLATVRDAALVVPTIAHALGLQDKGSRPLAEHLVAFLRPRQALLVLDNLEQVLAAAPELATLLVACPRLKILATSRSVLHLSGEHDVLVPPLALPPSESQPSVAEVAAAAAVRLFVARAEAARPDFVLTEQNAGAVAAVCQRLDGLPLAIELAATRVTHLPPASLLARLEQRLPLLTGGPQDLPARLQTMRSAIAWSYDLLTTQDQALFRSLSPFVGGFTLQAAEAIGEVGSEDAMSMLNGVASLVSHSLLHQIEEGGAGPRYTMLETIREYALERLLANGEEDAVRERHAAWFLSLAEASASQPAAFAHMDQLTAEHQNLRAALHWFAARRDGESLLRLTGALTWFWYFGGYLWEGRDWQERALATRAHASPRARLATLDGAAMLAIQQDDHERATALGEESLTLACAEKDRASEADAKFVLSRAASQRGAGKEALAFAAEAVALYRELEHGGRLPWAIQRLGVEAFISGDIAQAAALFAEALERFRAGSSTIGAAYALNNLGLARHAMGDRLEAAALCRERLLLLRDIRDPWETANLLELIAALASETGAAEQAARLRGAAAGLYETSGTQAQPYVRRVGDRAEAEARVHLGPEGYAAAWAAGHGLPFAQVIADARETVDTIQASLSAPDSTSVAAVGLSPREREVLRQMAEGKSDRQIADTLSISPKTAGNHVSSILAKLGVTTRTAAATHAVRHGLA